MHRMLARQLAKARTAEGSFDLDRLLDLVDRTYVADDVDRRRTDRAISQMIEEVDRLNERLHEAFEVTPEGLALFDAEDRYVLWNRRYEDLYPELVGVLEVGLPFADALRRVLCVGAYVEARGREEEWLAARLERHARPRNVEEQRLPDGRWIRVEECRTRNGGSIGIRVDITELKAREASFRLLFEENPMPMWVFDTDTLRFLSINEAAIAHYGHSREAFATMTVLDIRPPEDRDRALQAIDQALGNGHVERLWRHLKADGTPIDVQIYARPLTHEGRSAILVAAVDVTERLRTLEELQTTREFLDTVIENVPATLFVKDPVDRRYVLLNREGERLVGRPRDAVLGHTDADLFPPEVADRIARAESDLFASETRRSRTREVYDTAQDGRRVLSVDRLAIGDDHGGIAYLLCVAEDITERQLAEQRIAFLAHHDALTGLPNRAAFMERLDAALAEAQHGGGAFAVLSIDIDRFKTVNDVFGHPVGDLLLQEASLRLHEAAGGAYIARLGGDEFMLISADGPQPATAEDLGERLMAAMTRDFDLDQHRLRSAISIGVAVYPTDGREASTLLANADAALYRSKAEGRDTIRFFEAEMDRRLRDRRALQSDLGQALARHELTLHFQPQARIGGAVIGFEVLLRWTHPTRGPVSPAVFIPLAEESNLIVEISEWVLREACRTAAGWELPLVVGVNLSPVQFRHGDLPLLVQRILLETGLPPQRLELEITEGVLIDDFDRAVSILRRIKAMGVKVAMDDFGTGYSSLSYLQSFPFDKIKIDRSFVSSIGSNGQSTAIIRAVIGLCRGLDLPVIAEGVETEEQLRFLSEEHCDEIQGYLIGRPAPIGVYTDLLTPSRPQRRREGVA